MRNRAARIEVPQPGHIGTLALRAAPGCASQASRVQRWNRMTKLSLAANASYDFRAAAPGAPGAIPHPEPQRRHADAAR